MGISNLMDVIRDRSPDAIYQSPISRFKGQMVAVDLSIFAHAKFREILPTFVREKEDEDGTDESGSENDEDYEDEDTEPWYVDWVKLKKRWFTLFFNFAKDLIVGGVSPIFIFDGKALKIKKNEHSKREKQRKRGEELYQIAKTNYLNTKGRFQKNEAREKCKKAFISQTRFQKDLLIELKLFFEGLSFPVLQSIEESDYLIASLSHDGIINSCLSTDTDLIIYGISFLLTECRHGIVKIVDRKKFMDDLEVDNDKLIDLAIMLGCDYNEKVKGVGAKTGVRLLEQYNKLELLPVKYYKKELYRTIIRKRFSKLVPWEDVTDFSKSNVKNIDDLTFDKDKMLKSGMRAFQTVGLGDKWGDMTEDLRK